MHVISGIGRLALVLGTCLLAGGCAHDASMYSYQSSYDNSFYSPGIKFLSLPDAVKSTIRAQAGMAEILDISRNEEAERTYYKVWFFRGGSFPPLYIAPDGSVLNSDLTVSMRAPEEKYEEFAGHSFGTVSVADLPPAVVKTLKVEAPTQEVLKIEESGPDTNRVYKVEFKGRRAPAPLNIDATGKVVQPSAQPGVHK